MPIDTFRRYNTPSLVQALREASGPQGLRGSIYEDGGPQGLRGSIYEDVAGASAPTINIGPTQAQPAAAAAAGPAMMYNDTGRAKIFDDLYEQGMNKKANNAWDLAGGLALLAGGYYGKSQSDKAQRARDDSLGEWLKKNAPEYHEAFVYGDAEQRKEIAKQARATIVGRAEEARKKKEKLEGLDGIRRKMQEGASWDDIRKEALNSGNPDVAMGAITSGYEDLREEAKYRTTMAREEARRQRELAEKDAEREKAYQRGLQLFGGDTRRAMLYADGVKEPSKMEGLNRIGGNREAPVGDDGKPLPAGDFRHYPELYETATADTYKEAYSKELKVDTDRLKDLNTEVRTSSVLEAQLDAAERALGKVRSGAGGTAEHIVRKTLSAVGLSDREIAAAGEIAEASKLAVARQNRVGFPGSVTEKEMAWYFQAAPGLDKTPEGNRMIVKILRFNNKMAMEEVNDRTEWSKLRIGAGLPATRGSGFQQWQANRAEARKQKFLEELNADFEKMAKSQSRSREDRVNERRGGAVRFEEIP